MVPVELSNTIYILPFFFLTLQPNWLSFCTSYTPNPFSFQGLALTVSVFPS